MSVKVEHSPTPSRKRRLSHWLTGMMIAATVLSPFGARSETAQISQAVAWLEAQQHESGCWSVEDKTLVDTVEVFKSLRHRSSSVASLNRALLWLTTVPETDSDKIARKLQILYAVTDDASFLIGELFCLQNEDGGWGIGEGKQSSIADTEIALEALLKASPASTQAIGRGRDFLTSVQQSDGSWIFTDETGSSDLARTARIAFVLKNIELAGINSQALAATLNKSTAFIDEKLGTGSASTLDKAWCYLVLLKFRQPSELQDLLNVLTSGQSENGSWGNDIYTTAIALRALHAVRPPDTGELPDLTVTTSGLAFAPVSPQSGDTVVLSATVFNQGQVAAENVSVRFFDNDPRIGGTPIGETQTVPAIPAGGSAQASVSYSTTGLVGVRQIVVWADYENSINEISEINNFASKGLNIIGVPNLVVTPADIVFSEPEPTAFEELAITVTVHNTGTADAENISVEFLCNAETVAELTLSWIAAGSINTATLNTAFPAGTQHLTARVGVVADEADITDNEATITIEVIPPPASPPDLKITSIAVVPSAPLAGEDSAIKTVVVNQGGESAAGFDVELSSNGIQLHAFSGIELAAGQQAALTFVTSFASGDHILTAVADPANIIIESDDTNNSYVASLSVPSATTPPELKIEEFSVSPSPADTGENVKLAVFVKNNGTTTASSVVVRLYDNGVRLGNDVILPSISGGGRATLQFSVVFDIAGIHLLQVVVDPDNSMTVSLTVNECPRPNLRISSITFSDNSPPTGEPIRVFTTVTNSGTAASTPCKTLITKGYPFMDGTVVIAETDVPSLAPDTHVTLEAVYVPASAGHHEIYAFADSRQNVVESSEGDNILSRVLVVGGEPDLSITAADIIFSEPAPEAFVPFDITATIRNIGTGAAVNVPVRFLDNGEPVAELILSGVAPGGVNTATLTTALSAGTHNLTVKIDPEHTLTRETNIVNNEATRVIEVAVPPPSPPDLKILSTIVTPAAPVAGENVTIKTVVVNQGGEPATGFDVELSSNGILLHAFNGIELAAGQQAVLSFTTVFTGGDHALTAIVDPVDAVTESDETNNAMSIELTVATASAPPDFQAFAISVLGSSAAGEPVVLELQVKNNGTVAAANVVVRWFDDNVPIGDLTIPEIAGGQIAIIRFSHVFASAGVRAVRAIVDPDNLFEEIDETDNEASAQTTVTASQMPDLQIIPAGITVSNAAPAPGETVTLYITVANVGTQPAGPFKVLATRGNPLESGAILIKEFAIDSLAANSSVSLQTSYTATAGTQNIHAFADYEQAVSEADKTNNLASISLASAPAPDLSLNADYITVSHTDLSLGSIVALRGVVDNTGEVSSPATLLRIINTVGDNAYVVGTIPVPAIGAGGAASFEISWQPARGMNQLTLVADAGEQVAESNESNNETTRNFTFTLPHTEVNLCAVIDGTEIETDSFAANQLQRIKVFHGYSNAMVYFRVFHSSGALLATNNDIYLEDNTFTWDTTNTPPTGDGQHGIAKVVICDHVSGVVLEQHVREFTISPTVSVKFAQVKPDVDPVIANRSYVIRLTAYLINGSNIDGNFELHWQLSSPNSEVLFNGTKTVAMPASMTQNSFGVDDIAYDFPATGEYVLAFDVISNGNVIYSKSEKMVCLPKIRIEACKSLTPDTLAAGAAGTVKVEIKLKGVQE